MGWSGESKEFKNEKKKKEIIENKELYGEYLDFVKIESGYIYFKLYDEKHDLWEDNKTYKLIFRVKMFDEYSSNIKYTLLDVINKIDKNYDNMQLFRTVWRR